MKALLEIVGRLMPVVAGMLLVVSAIYDFVFLHFLGLSFIDVPTNLNDHARSALIWLPSVLPIAMLFWMQYNISKRSVDISEAGETEKKKSNTWFYITILMAVVLVLIGDGPGYIIMAVFYVLMVTPSIWMRLLGLGEIKSVEARVGVYVVILLLILVPCIAFFHASEMVSSEAKWKVEVKSTIGYEIVQAAGLRRFNNFSILVDVSGGVQIFDNNDISTVALANKNVKGARYSCRWLGVLCSETNKE